MTVTLLMLNTLATVIEVSALNRSPVVEMAWLPSHPLLNVTKLLNSPLDEKLETTIAASTLLACTCPVLLTTKAARFVAVPPVKMLPVASSPVNFVTEPPLLTTA